jgi:ankyrin repeat protein
MSNEATVSREVPAQEVVDSFVNLCHGRFEQVKAMLQEHPGLINAPSTQNETGIQAASHTGQKEIVKYLLERGATFDICVASVLGLEDDARRMLEADPSLKNAKGAHGYPLMLFAALGGSLAVAKLLRSHGVDVTGGEGVWTPLHAAVWADKPDIVGWLIDEGAPVGAKDYGGKTAVDFARSQQREAIVRLFEQRQIH